MISLKVPLPKVRTSSEARTTPESLVDGLIGEDASRLMLLSSKLILSVQPLLDNYHTSAPVTPIAEPHRTLPSLHSQRAQALAQ